MKKMISLLLAALLLCAASLASAGMLEPEDTEIEKLAGKTVHATVGEYDTEDKTFTVTIYENDRYDEDDVRALAVGDRILAGGRLYRILEEVNQGGTRVFKCEDGEEIYFEESYEDDDDLIARSTSDDRIFMKAVAILHLPAAEGIIYEDYSDPDLEAEPIITEGLEGILQAKAEKEEYSIGFDFYATTITLNASLEIVKIHQDFDVAQ